MTQETRAHTRTGTETETSTQTKTARPWSVIVHDDPITLMSYVTQVFVMVFGYSRAKAERHMFEVHNTGRSVLWTGTREKAEVYVTKLQSFHLRTTMEQVEG